MDYAKLAKQLNSVKYDVPTQTQINIIEKAQNALQDAQEDVTDRNRLLEAQKKEINRLEAEKDDLVKTNARIEVELDNTKAKLSSQVDPIKLVDWLEQTPIPTHWTSQQIVQQFKKHNAT